MRYTPGLIEWFAGAPTSNGGGGVCMCVCVCVRVRECLQKGDYLKALTS